MQRFRAPLYKIGMLRCVDVPLKVSRRLGGESSIAVRGRAGGVPFRTTVVARGGGAHRLYVHSRAWRPQHLDSGDTIGIEIERDDEPRGVAMSGEFLRALDDRPAARAEFLASGAGLHREIANWLAAAKQAVTRERRIEKALDTLESRGEQRRRRRVR